MSNQAEIDINRISAVLEVILARKGKPVVLHDETSGVDLPLEYDEVASPIGLLPAFLVAAEAVWHEATGNGFSIEIVEQPKTLLGYAVKRIGGGNFSSIMLSILEVHDQIDDGSATLVSNKLMERWGQSPVKAEANTTASSAPASSSSPSAG